MLYRLTRRSASGLTALLIALAAHSGCATSATARIPPAPILLRWPDPTFAPERQCRGEYNAEDLARYLPRARLAMTLPGTQRVALDRGHRCLTVEVQTVGSGRLAELVLRGVAVPRRAVLLRLVDERVPRPGSN